MKEPIQNSITCCSNANSSQDITISQSRKFFPTQDYFPGFSETYKQILKDNPLCKYIGVHAWHQYTPEPPSWLVDEMLHVNTINLMTGSGASGKSLLAEQLAISLASGAPWLNFQVKQTGHVIYLNAEDPDGESHRRYLRTLEKLNLTTEQLQLLKDNLTHIPMNELDDVDSSLVDACGATTKTYGFLQELTKALKPILIIIDPLIYFTDGNENDSVSARRLYSALKALKSTVLLTHHMSKAGMNNEVTQRTKSRGSSVFTENARSSISLENEILTIDKNNYGKRYVGDDVIKLVIEDGLWRRKTPTEVMIAGRVSTKTKRSSY